MKKSFKGALLSGLVFPGVGQLWLKHTIRGIALVLAVVASLALIVTKVAQQAFTILEKVESEGGAVDLVAIFNAAHAYSVDDSVIRCASLVLMAAWIISIVDAYLLGEKEGREDPGKDSARSRTGAGKPPSAKGGPGSC